MNVGINGIVRAGSPIDLNRLDTPCRYIKAKTRILTREEQLQLKYTQRFTTGDVAKVLKISIAAVNKLLDKGAMKFTLVGEGTHKRVAREELKNYIRNKKVELPWYLRDEPQVLLIGCTDGLINHAKSQVSPEEMNLVGVKNPTDATLCLDKYIFTAVVIDLSIGNSEALNLLRLIRSNLKREVKVIALCGEGNYPEYFKRIGFNDAYSRNLIPDARLFSLLLDNIVPWKSRLVP